VPFKRNLIDLLFKQSDYEPSIDLYKARARALAAKSKGVERLAYLIFGVDNIAIWAYSLDPYRKYRLSLGRISTSTRFRQFPAVRFSARTAHRTQKNRSTDVTVSTIPGQSGESSSEFTAEASVTPLAPQDAIYGFIHDTSKKTRKPGFDQGEFELYVPKFTGVASNYGYPGNTNTSTYTGTGYFEEIRYHEDISYGLSSPSIYLPSVAHNAWLSDLRATTLSFMAERAPGLAAKTLPTAWRFKLIYNVAELRELPFLLRESTKFYKDVLSLNISIKKGSDAYLAYRFGWESTWQAIQQLLRIVPNVNKEINNLIIRNGKATSLHYGYSFSDLMGSSPAFATDVSPHDESIGAGISVDSHDSGFIKCTLNVNIDLPRVAVPVLAEKLVARKFGGDLPSPVEVLDFIPWTWLTDYFNHGFEYLKIIDAMNFDQNTVNYGFISLTMSGKAKVDFTGKTTLTDIVTTLPPYVSTTQARDRTAERSAQFEYKYRIRRSISGLADVKILSDGKNLSGYQSSILAALTGKYSSRGRK